ncbi:hypothetical protein [Agrobacterium tumefaciens]|uniref:hypothetical protein n=1 Tax=Agrobacterium tumefaciens TaxID=358 RepID=UPI00287C4230|nr:hypothetical protein [Agrobacterium tumefaciens]MDS7595732.1 hypothetical protein [Agrobacterium tumefaciens]
MTNIDELVRSIQADIAFLKGRIARSQRAWVKIRNRQLKKQYLLSVKQSWEARERPVTAAR